MENLRRSSLYAQADNLCGANITIVGGGDIDKSIFSGSNICAINGHYKRQGINPDFQFADDINELVEFANFYAISSRNYNEFTKWSKKQKLIPTLILWSTEMSRKTSPIGLYNEWLHQFCHELQTRPLTGIIAVKFFDLLPVREIRITGFDFYSSGSSVPKYRDSHKIDPQLKWLAKKCRNDSRFKPDSQLIGLFKELGELA